MTNEKMDHGYFKDRISAYKDQDLPPYEYEAVGQHLQDCEECQALLADLEKLDRLVEKHSGIGGDDYFEQQAQKIEAALGIAETEVVDVREEAAKRSPVIWKWVGVAASVAVLTFIGLHQTDILDSDDYLPDRATEQDVPADMPPAGEQSQQPDEGEPAATDKPESSQDVVEPVEEEQIDASPTVQPDAVRQQATESEDQPAATTRAASPTGAAQSTQEEGQESSSEPEQPVGQSEAETRQFESVKPRLGIESTDSKQLKSLQADEDKSAAENLVEALPQRTAPAPVRTDRSVELSESEQKQLTYWKAIQDSLVTVREAEAKQKSQVRQKSAKSKAARSSGGSVSQGTDTASDSVAVERDGQLLQAAYQVARLTQDQADRNRSLEIIEGFAQDEKSPHRDRAKTYLKELVNR